MKALSFMLRFAAVLLFAVPLRAQTDVPVEIVSYSLRESGVGFLIVVGEVRNTYPNPLCFVQIDIEYLDESGKPIGVDRFTAKDAGTMALDQVMASRGVIPPGETSPFERVRDTSKIKGKVASCKVTAKGLRLKESNAAATITNVQVAREGSDFRITGTFNATGKAPCKNPVAVAAGYDQNGKIQVVTMTYLTSDGTSRSTPLRQVDAGKSQAFNLLLLNRTGTVTSVKVFPSFECD
ncbi:MAG: hypothetical protein RMI34_00945 [Chloroherpetonaceae bacterium]|nr:hypothetical protein [Chloroherpetonaceae bacterium]